MPSTYDPHSGYTERGWPHLRNAVLAVLEQSRPHACAAFLEIDVTETLARLHACQDALRMAVSLQAIVLHTLSRAAAAHPGVLTYKHGRRLVTFTEADVCLAIDRLILGQRVPAIYCVRGAHRKSLAEINWELRATLHPEGPRDPAVPIRRRVAALPAWARRIFNRTVRANPHWVRRLYGTVALTSLQSPGMNFPFWGVPPTVCTLTAAVGSLVKRPGFNAQGNVVERRHLCMTGTADHAVIDGMALSRFTTAFVRGLESCADLNDDFVRTTRELAARDPKTRGARPLPA